MRILTWNLDHGFHGKPLFDAQAELIEAARADIAVLTELPVEWSSTSDEDGKPARGPMAWFELSRLPDVRPGAGARRRSGSWGARSGPP